MPSRAVIFFLVLIKSRNKKIAATKKTNNGASSENKGILIGEKTLIKPKPKVGKTIPSPTIPPKASQSFCFLAAVTIKNNSGKEVPKATTKIPKTAIEKLK